MTPLPSEKSSRELARSSSHLARAKALSYNNPSHFIERPMNKPHGHNKPILIVKHLAKSYGGKTVVNNLSFDIGKGEVVGLLGPNGAGKTTAFYMTIGLIRPDAGQVFFKGKEATNLPLHKRALM